MGNQTSEEPQVKNDSKEDKSTFRKLHHMQGKFKHIAYNPLPGKTNGFAALKSNPSVNDSASIRYGSRNIEKENFLYWHQIGQLQMIFDDNTAYVGTATVIGTDSRHGVCYALTCASNLVKCDSNGKGNNQISHVKYAWFDRRVSKKSFFTGQNYSESIITYPIDFYKYHEKYDPKTSSSSYDVAIIAFVDNDLFFQKFYGRFWFIPEGHLVMPSITDAFKNDGLKGLMVRGFHEVFCTNNHPAWKHYLYIGGFPGQDKKGQLWETASGTVDETKMVGDYDNCLQNRMNTTVGQSGAAIVHFTGMMVLDIVAIQSRGPGKRDDYEYDTIAKHATIINDEIKKWIVSFAKSISNSVDIQFGFGHYDDWYH